MMPQLCTSSIHVHVSTQSVPFTSNGQLPFLRMTNLTMFLSTPLGSRWRPFRSICSHYHHLDSSSKIRKDDQAYRRASCKYMHKVPPKSLYPSLSHAKLPASSMRRCLSLSRSSPLLFGNFASDTDGYSFVEKTGSTRQHQHISRVQEKERMRRPQKVARERSPANGRRKTWD